ncbi:glycerol-3-phosphate dehydrogenase/oxidase [candidate division KSB1 bacterium]|nr:glycerol-3-phosphate dehydrogenase/oxidase [candidate division KSB1 bacterium]
MHRNDMLAKMFDNSKIWDFIIIGGGATGLGTALEASSRGYQTLLVEQHDFGKGTSSRSTKLVHGGVRYLQQGNVSLVLEALKERGLLLQNAPHLVNKLKFIVPTYRWWDKPYYGIGLKLYDLLSGKHSFGASKILSKADVLHHIPVIEPKNLKGGILYYDGQFDDARLLVNLAQTAEEQGAVVLNYMQAIQLKKSGERISGVVVQDMESGSETELRARAVINATGVFTDGIRILDDPTVRPMIAPSQGVHIVLDRSFLPGDSALMIPRTSDGRVLFAIPWLDRVIVGTTDTPVNALSFEPAAKTGELAFLLEHAAQYLSKDPAAEDVKSVFVGLRPLVSLGKDKKTAAISRDYMIQISKSGLVTITGGKWTTYRKMAQDTIDHALRVAQLKPNPSVSERLPIHGYDADAAKFGDLKLYGTDAGAIQELVRQNPKYGERLHPELPIVAGEVIWAVRNEMARTVEDVLARRTRALFLDARASMEMAPVVAGLMAAEMGKNEDWISDQVATFRKLAHGYLIKS